MALAVTASVQDGITPTLDDLARQYPQFYKKALMDLGSRWRKTIAREMRAGAPAGQPFAPLHPLTLRTRQERMAAIRTSRRQLRAEGVAATSKRARSLTRRKTLLQGFGGRLPGLVEYSTTDGVRVGFIGAVFKRSDRAGARWMRRESRAWDKGERHWLHQMYGETIPFASYARPERQAVAPQQTRWSADTEATIRNSIQARIDAAAAKKVNAFLTPKVGSL